MRRGVRVLKASGIGHQCDVQRFRDLGRQLDVQEAQEVAHDLTRRRGIPDDGIDAPEARVVVVVVDVDHEGRPGQQLLVVAPEAHLFGAVQREQHPLISVRRELALQLVELHEPVLGRQRHLPVQVHDPVLPELRRERAWPRGSTPAHPRPGSRGS